jgi:malonyl-CoA O-methyltransferase
MEYLPAQGVARQELVLLHGWGGTRDVWRPLLAQLRDWANVTLLDIPGCAPQLAAGDYSLKAILADVLRHAPEQAVYVGFSLGGKLALELANLAPDRVLAICTLCCNPCFVASDDWPGMAPDVFKQFSENFAKDGMATLSRFNALQAKGSPNARAVLKQLREREGEVIEGKLDAGLHWLASLDQRELITSLATPQCHLYASNDALVPAGITLAMEESVPRAGSNRVKLLTQSSHLLPAELPGPVADELASFLSQGNLLDEAQLPSSAVNKTDVAASFSRAANTYDSVAHLQRDVGDQLLKKLPGNDFQADVILDLGCGTGYFAPELKARFPEADYIGVDIAPGMVSYARERHEPDGKWLVGDAENLPLAPASVDLVFSSLAIQWCARPELILAELQRILRPGGKCVFTSLGPATLQELRAAWASVDDHAHVNTFLPSTQLHCAARSIPALSLDLSIKNVVLSYQKVRDLLDELKILGAHNMNQGRPQGLTSRRSLQGMLAAYEGRREDGVLPATYEVFFGVLERA